MAEAAIQPDLEADLNNLTMSVEAEPLLAAVKTFIQNEIEPETPEFESAADDHGDRWSMSPKQ